MKAILKVCDGIKWNEVNTIAECYYNNIYKYEVRKISKDVMGAKGYVETDKYDEYLILTFDNGEMATFRNSRVDLFIMWN